MKTMKTLKTLKDKREGLPEEEERDGSRPDVENKVKAKQSKAKADVAPMLGLSPVWWGDVVGLCGVEESPCDVGMLVCRRRK